MYAAPGVQAGDNPEPHQQTALQLIPVVKQNAQGLGSVAPGNQEGLGQIAMATVRDVTAVAEAAKNVAKLAQQRGDTEKEQVVLQATKRVAMANAAALRAAKNLAQNPNNTQAMQNRSQFTQRAVTNASALEALLSEGMGELTPEEQTLAAAQQQLQGMLQQFHAGHTNKQKTDVEPEDIINDARNIAQETAGVVLAANATTHGATTANPQLTQSIQVTVAACAALLDDANAGAQNAPSNDLGVPITTAAGSVVDGVVQLFETAKKQCRHPSPKGQRMVSGASATVVTRVNDVVAATDVLPRKSVDTDNLEDLAAQELAACAKAIEDAAKMLVARPSSSRSGLDAFEEITDDILEAAQGIALATKQLVIIATKAQKEISAAGDGNATKKVSVYQKDPAWARGLISAAQAVAGAVKHLVNAANKAARKEGSEEELIATSRQVNAATIRLVAAARAKADPFSRTQQELKGAAQAVQHATNDLVNVAQRYDDVMDEENVDGTALDETAVARMRREREEANQLAMLQKQLQAAEQDFMSMNKDRYKAAGQ
eukprot:Plantae.Rhodophyta-Palmaria_palmata.ctg7192.p1 GENE.Plantae.Rhodophyta-Palmaria_palmata.ctg7192~~Plantae.Rhodophyta-Palmaria_palmata.ctg7192.p1  ORF type:complete len:625 (+),score=104.21 Plantae.Rhodophyta-Palmaria_palmata.ctg7192:238-1875(+)